MFNRDWSTEIHTCTEDEVEYLLGKIRDWWVAVGIDRLGAKALRRSISFC